MTDSKKTKYVKMHEQDVKRHEKEMKELDTKGYFTNSEGIKSTDIVAKKYKYPTGTKMPPIVKSDYQFYVQENIDKIMSKQNLDKE